MAVIEDADIEAVLPNNAQHGQVVQQILSYDRQAEIESRERLGDEVYDALRTAAPEDQDRKDLVQAEALVCVAKAIQVSNLRLTKQGGIVRATGLEQTRQEYQSQREVKRYAKTLMGQANSLYKGLVPDDKDDLEGAGIHIASI